jgi:hypothetical protein
MHSSSQSQKTDLVIFLILLPLDRFIRSRTNDIDCFCLHLVNKNTIIKVLNTANWKSVISTSQNMFDMKNSSAKQIAELQYDYEIDPETSFGDLVYSIEELAIETGDINLSISLSNYRNEESYDRHFLGMRGDMETVENEFIETIRLLAEKGIPKADQTAPAPNDSWDYTLTENTIENSKPYPAVLIDKVVGAREQNSLYFRRQATSLTMAAICRQKREQLLTYTCNINGQKKLYGSRNNETFGSKQTNPLQHENR